MPGSTQTELVASPLPIGIAPVPSVCVGGGGDRQTPRRFDCGENGGWHSAPGLDRGDVLLFWGRGG